MWPYFFDHLRHCGRSGAPFFFVVTAVIGSLSLGPWGGLIFLGLVAVGLLWVLSAAAEQRDHFERLGKLPPLSDHDWRVARSKLRPSRGRR